ncbi:MAG: hypothetical protein ACK56I_33940, partial [bacterium]
ARSAGATSPPSARCRRRWVSSMWILHLEMRGQRLTARSAGATSPPSARFWRRVSQACGPFTW